MSLPDAAMPRVLVVDDEIVIRRLVERYCSGLGSDVVSAGGAAETRAILAESDRALDVAVIDKNMPDVNGIELLRELRERFPDLAAVVMTADPTDASRAAADELGAIAFLEKPFSIADLDQALRRALAAAEAVPVASQDTVARLRALTERLRSTNERFSRKE